MKKLILLKKCPTLMGRNLCAQNLNWVRFQLYHLIELWSFRFNNYKIKNRGQYFIVSHLMLKKKTCPGLSDLCQIHAPRCRGMESNFVSVKSVETSQGKIFNQVKWKTEQFTFTLKKYIFETFCNFKSCESQ